MCSIRSGASTSSCGVPWGLHRTSDIPSAQLCYRHRISRPTSKTHRASCHPLTQSAFNYMHVSQYRLTLNGTISRTLTQPCNFSLSYILPCRGWTRRDEVLPDSIGMVCRVTRSKLESVLLRILKAEVLPSQHHTPPDHLQPTHYCRRA